MANKVRFLIDSVLDDATIDASSATDGLPASNVQHRLIRREYHSTGKLNEYLHFEASGGPTGVDCVFIGRHNFSKGATVLWQGNSTSNFASGPALSTTLTVATDGQGSVVKKLAHFYSTPQTHPHWRLSVSDSGNASSTLRIGRIVAGRYIEPERNLREGFTISVVDPSSYRATAGRQGYVNERDDYLEFDYSVYNTEAPQRDELVGIYNAVGQHQAFVFALDPEDRPHHHTIYAQFKGDMRHPQTLLHQFSLSPIGLQEKN